MTSKIKTKDIGKLNGRVLVFGGVYSNWQALQAMQEVAITEGIAPSNIICTGDVVGYCAEPERCVQAIKAWGIHCIAGNVELQLREGENDCGCDFNTGSRCDLFSKQWYPYAQEALSKEAIAWMWTLPHHLRFDYADLKGIVLHGSFFGVSDYVFASTPWTKKNDNFNAAQSDLILAGHSGLPWQEEKNGKYWLNAGVIGMPANDGTPRVWYMILDTDPQGQITYQQYALAYDYHTAAELMKNAQLPQAYALTLKTGLWDNCEILPETETALQGVKIEVN
ncbi:MAG: metallophosphoesterase family protein [Bacteroidota bacterium]